MSADPHVSADDIIAGLTACIVCDEPDSEGYRAEVRYWLEQLIMHVKANPMSADQGREQTIKRLVLKYARTGIDYDWVVTWLTACAEEVYDAGRASLAAENAQLKAWKESAMVQLGKSDALMELLPMPGYWGWDVFDATVDYIKKLQAQIAQDKSRMKIGLECFERIEGDDREELKRLREALRELLRTSGIVAFDDCAEGDKYIAARLHAEAALSPVQPDPKAEK